MTQCLESPNVRIEKIRENLKKQIERNDDMILPQSEMTDVLGGVIDVEMDQPTIAIGGSGENNNSAQIGVTPPGIIPDAPKFKVPANPLLPPEYREVINYNDLQYANGFFRTQIGRYVKADCLVGSNQIITKYGYLVGVGLNYILLQEAVTKNILSVDFWSIKFMYFYYNKQDLKRVMPFAEEGI